MADLEEKEKLLQEKIAELEEQQAKLAEMMEQVAGIDCNFGACVFDENIESVELKLEEVQRRKKALESIMRSLRECE